MGGWSQTRNIGKARIRIGKRRGGKVGRGESVKEQGKEREGVRKKRRGGWSKGGGMLDRENVTKKRETWLALYHFIVWMRLQEESTDLS